MPPLPNYGDGTPTLVQSEGLALDAADLEWGGMSREYLTLSMAELPRSNAARQTFDAAVVNRQAEAVAMVDYATPIAAGTFPDASSYKSTMTISMAHRVIQSKINSVLPVLMNDYVLAAVQTLSSGDAWRVQWQHRADLLLAGEIIVRDSAIDYMNSLPFAPEIP